MHWGKGLKKMKSEKREMNNFREMGKRTMAKQTSDFHRALDSYNAHINSDLQKIKAIEQALHEHSKREEERKNTLEAGAKASIYQKELMEKVIGLLLEQNEALLGNCTMLKDMYDAQVKATEDSREDLRRSRIFNGWMMIIAVISMAAAIAGPVIPIMVDR